MNDLQANTKGCEALRQQLLAHHNIQLQLCEELEEIADILPNVTNTQKILIICKDISSIVKKLLSQFLPLQAKDNLLSRDLGCLRYEH